jgi:ferredoxin
MSDASTPLGTDGAQTLRCSADAHDSALSARALPAWVARVLPLGFEWPAPAGVDLVSSAQAAGWRLARSCRNGVCRGCMCRLVRGEVRYRIEWPGLSREEQAEGWILPCVAEPVTDVVIEVSVNP